ncbi:MAG: phenylacetate--CoA ligase [Lachnospiraceae bacterium]|nr:phenylacetate--CoA ligase [Lachnospiraceae bacterium]
MKISEKQLEAVDRQIKRILKSGNYYSGVYKKAGISGVSSPEDFEKIPFTDKADLRNAYPLGIQAVPDEEVVRIHSSSGTTGKPVIIPYTAKDVEDWALMFARCFEIAGVTAKDRIQITPGYGLWTAGIGFQAGCEKLGAMAIPMGPGNTEKQLQMMIDLESTVICATSSYALLLAEEINKRGLKDKIKLKKGVIGSERWSDAKRNYIAKELGIELYDIYGLTEIYGPGIGINCPDQQGMHIFDDYLYTEIINPDTGEVLPDGEKGEIVITTLVKEGAPLIRFRTHDLSRMIPGDCSCGRHYPRLDTILGRSDDMFKVHGVNIFPSQVEEVLSLVDGVSSEYKIDIAHDDNKNRDIIMITAEAEGRVDFVKTGESIKKIFKSKMNVTPNVTIVSLNTLPRSEKKTQRVFDHRED